MTDKLSLADYDPTPEPEVPQTYAFDRRYSARHPVTGRVTVQRCDHDTQAYRHRICSVELCDMGAGGMAAYSDVAIAPNETVAVFLPSHGAEQGLDLRGHVVRCQPTFGGYQVAIAFDQEKAA